MTAIVNGEERELERGATLAALLAELGLGESAGIAVAVNESVVPRAAFDRHAIAQGDRIEIIRAVAGG